MYYIARTFEFESGAVNDLKKAIDRIAPEDIYYEHNERWRDGIIKI
ncbi:MAG: hypothetical protein MUP26_04050 [Desulfobulbaceae bacterium]|nr:hypothetical protein [Desulfobulbaceae bacterium]